MGRPLNSKFFGPDGPGFQIACNVYFNAGADTGYIIKQKSNRKYLVAKDSTVASGSLVTGRKYVVVADGTTNWASVGAGSKPGGSSVGVVFTATGTAAGTGTASEVGICKLVNNSPITNGEMQVVVTPEMAQAPRQATIAITAANGTDELLTVEIVDPGYGYFSAGTAVAQDGGDGTIDYTVANGQLATVGINTAGTANVDGTYDIDDAPAVSAPVENAKRIKANQVQTFGNPGNRYVWPATDSLGDPGAEAGSGSPSGMGEATLGGG